MIWSKIIWATSWNLFMPYVNNKDTDQPAYACSLMGIFVTHSIYRQYNTYSRYTLNSESLASFSSWAGRFGSYLVISRDSLLITWLLFVFNLDFTACQDYFTHFEPSQSLGGVKTGDPQGKRQASITWLVSHMTWARLKPTVVRWRAIRACKISGLNHSAKGAAYSS